VFVALGIQQAMRMRHFIICSLPGSTTILHIVFYILLTVHLDIISGRWPTWGTVLLYNAFI